MSDTVTRIYQQEEALRESLADVMLVALREQGGQVLTSDAWYRLKEKLMDALRGQITL